MKGRSKRSSFIIQRPTSFDSFIRSLNLGGEAVRARCFTTGKSTSLAVLPMDTWMVTSHGWMFTIRKRVLGRHWRMRRTHVIIFKRLYRQDKLYAIAGRTTSQRTNQGFDLTVKPVDVYDLTRQRWLAPDECPALPTGRAGNMAMTWGDEIVVAGGESASQESAHRDVEAYNVKSKTWRRWAPLNRGRHGSGFARVGDYVYTASGSGDRGGGPELTSVERMKLPPVSDTKVSAANVDPVKRWHTKTLSFHGPQTSESATPNPFTDYRLLVTFSHPKATYVVRGFYSADGNAAETSATEGNVWQVRFSPDHPGEWNYKASLRSGTDIAISNDPVDGTPIAIANATGSFSVAQNNLTGASRDFRRRGRVIVDGTYFRLGNSGPYWLKGGTDSPENLLAYADFDDTFRISAETTKGEATPTKEVHRYEPHIRDWREGDPQWQQGKGKGLIGAINYLSSTGMNVAYFLTMNIGGDGKDVWPYVAADEWTRFDCSKLDQWEIVFEHMQQSGILLHVVTQETENERMLDDGDTGRLRKLYYHELISRFAHHPGLVWNLGEENGPADFSPHGQSAEQQMVMASFLKRTDPYCHPVVIHTHSTPHGKDEVLTALLGHKPLDGLSFQINKPESVHSELIRWREKSHQAGHTWLISMDEIGPWHTGAVTDNHDPDHASLRRHVLWGSLMAGAAGVEWYFGANFPHNDLTCEDWRQRANVWKQTRHALEFFQRHLRYWEMSPAAALVSDRETFCFAKQGFAYALYIPANRLNRSNEMEIDLAPRDREYSIRWYDPLNGGDLKRGSVSTAQPSKKARFGSPPSNHELDWVVLIN